MKEAPFQKLRIWKEAHSLTVAVYDLAKTFPDEERFGLISQIRRSASSVSANIAEGLGMNTPKQTVNFLGIALGSLNETIQHCLLARDLGYCDRNQAEEIIDRYNGLAAGVRRFIVHSRRFYK